MPFQAQSLQSCRSIENPHYSLVEAQVPWTPLNYFENYFDDDFWGPVSDQTRVLQNGLQLNTFQSEIRQLVGSHIIMGCLNSPCIRLLQVNNTHSHYHSDSKRQSVQTKKLFTLWNDLDVTDEESK